MAAFWDERLSLARARLISIGLVRARIGLGRPRSFGSEKPPHSSDIRRYSPDRIGLADGNDLDISGPILSTAFQANL